MTPYVVLKHMTWQSLVLIGARGRLLCAPPQAARARILVQVTIYRKLLIGRDGHLDQSEAYDIS